MSYGFVYRHGKRWQNQSCSDNKGSVSVYRLTPCIDCATGCCLHSGNKEVSECAQTYRLHRLYHRVLFAGKESDGKIN